MKEEFDGYGWIKVKKYRMDESKSWEERYRQLEQHHIEETTFLIAKVRELAASIECDHRIAVEKGKPAENV